MASWDVIVVGLGAMGSAALYELSRRGLRVLGLEAFEPGHRMGSHHGESRVIRLAYFEHPSYVPLLRRAYTLWSELEHESGRDLLTLTGGLMLGLPNSELVSGARASAELHHLEHEFLQADEVRYRYPAFTPAEDDVALWEPRSGYLRPERCIETFVELARSRGAETRYSEPVGSWHANADGVQLRTSSDTLDAGQVVFACGARMTSVLGESIPPVVAERAVLFLMQPAQRELFQNLPIYLWDTPDGQTFYGFPHVDLPGAKVAMHHTGEFCDPETVDRTVNAHDESRLRTAIGSRLPTLNGPVLDSLVCLYENSPDQHFMIDRLPDQPNVIYAGGFSGHGFKFASVVGEILADLVTRGEATPDADFLRAERLLRA
jgi:sarcosine oxidase